MDHPAVAISEPRSNRTSEPTAFPRELTLFLVQLSAALNKSRAYPPGHPVLSAATDVVIQHLHALLRSRPHLTIGVSRDRLVVDQVASDPDHPVHRDLAERLHRHQFAALQFRPGIALEEVTDLLGALAGETWRSGRPLGLESEETLRTRWPHVSLEPLPLDQLELGDDASGEAGRDRVADRLWQGLVTAALQIAEEHGADPTRTGERTPKAVAETIRTRSRDPNFSRKVVDWLVEMGEQTHSGEAGAPLREKLQALFSELDVGTLEQVLQAGATPEQRRQLMYRGSRTLPIGAVLDLLKASTPTSDRNLSKPLLRILGKLAGHSEPGRGPVVTGAEEAVRDSVRQLVVDWDQDDPASAQHRELLDLLSRPLSAAGSEKGVERGRTTSGALRLAQLGLEVGIVSPAVSHALHQVASRTEFAAVIGMIDQGTEAGLDMRPLWDALAQPGALGPHLHNEAVDVQTLGRALDALGERGLAPLLDALEQAESASRRKWILARLERFGPRLGPLLVERLPGKPWFVVRNLLNLLGTLPELPPDFTPVPWTQHDDPRARREAYKLAFARLAWRAEAILRAVEDGDAGIVRLALVAAQEDCPPELPERLLVLLRDRIRDPDDRVVAIRLLGKRPTPAARDWLVRQVVADRGLSWFRRQRLQAKSREMLTAIGVLARHYADEPAVQAVLRLAKASADRDVQSAVRVERT